MRGGEVVAEDLPKIIWRYFASFLGALLETMISNEHSNSGGKAFFLFSSHEMIPASRYLGR